MDRKNILSEGFFDSLKKFFTRPKLSPEEKKMMKNPEFKKLYNDILKNSRDIKAVLDKERQKQKEKRVKSKYYQYK
tara:strand:+ start:725 stop:952 length:228 start_codon:yes stop_codon:yes gene_type:complete